MITKVTEFLEYKKDKDDIADSTVNSYRRVVDEFLNIYRAANERTIKDYLEYLNRSNASARTINFKMSVMNQYQMYITGCKKSRITRRVNSMLRTTYSKIDYSELLMHLCETNQLMYLACLFVSNGIKLTEFKYIKYDDLCEGYIVLPDMKYKLDQIHESVSPHIKANVKRSVIDDLSKLQRVKFYDMLENALDELGLSAYPASSIVLRDTQLIQDLANVWDVCMLTDVCDKYRITLGSLGPYIEESKLIVKERER